jgi:RHS repeat-associated protein
VRYVDELVCRDDTTPERLYATQDANFNLTSISNTSGGVVERYQFDPYGNRTIMNASWGVISASAYNWYIGHQGLLYDAESGLVYNRARYYHTALGVFLRRDPILDFRNNTEVPFEDLWLKHILRVTNRRLYSTVFATKHRTRPPELFLDFRMYRETSNYYLYCEASPLTFADPYGLVFCCTNYATGASACRATFVLCLVCGGAETGLGAIGCGAAELICVAAFGATCDACCRNRGGCPQGCCG